VEIAFLDQGYTSSPVTLGPVARTPSAPLPVRHGGAAKYFRTRLATQFHQVQETDSRISGAWDNRDAGAERDGVVSDKS